MAVFHGVNINWGIDTDIQDATGLFQTREHGIRMNSEVITDGGETPVSKVYWGIYEEATFTYVATDFTYRNGNAQYFLPDIGSTVYVSDTVNNQLDGNWMVDNVSTHTSNTTATRVTLKLTRYPMVDAAISNI